MACLDLQKGGQALPNITDLAKQDFGRFGQKLLRRVLTGGLDSDFAGEHGQRRNPRSQNKA